jgi:hypothetical protein
LIVYGWGVGVPSPWRDEAAALGFAALGFTRNPGHAQSGARATEVTQSELRAVRGTRNPGTRN